MDEEHLISRVRELGGFEGRADALRATRATLLALGERLQDDERAALTRELPTELRPALDRCAYRGDFDREELFARVALHANVARGFAAELAEVACRALGELLPNDPLVRLRKELGASIELLFDPPDPEVTIPRSPGRGSTLASGHEGSRHPLSASRYDAAHRESVARSEDPHGRSKLSGAHGLSQEREGTTLAEGRPGPRRTIAETKD